MAAGVAFALLLLAYAQLGFLVSTPVPLPHRGAAGGPAASFPSLWHDTSRAPGSPGHSVPILPAAPLAGSCPCPSPFVATPQGRVGGDIEGQVNTLLLLPSHHTSSVPPQLFSSSSECFRSVGSSLLLLLALLRGSASLQPCLPEASGLYCLFCSSYIVLEVWLLLRLLAVVLIHSYREMRFELYRPAFEPQDYEMVELFVRRLKMWMGFSKAKEVRAAWGLCGTEQNPPS